MEQPRYRPHSQPVDKGYRSRGAPHPRPRTQSPPARRRRPSLWDSRDFPYGIPVPPPRGALVFGDEPLICPPARPAEAAVLSVPAPHERGPLAGVNVAALRALLTGAELPPAAPTPAAAAASGSSPWAVRGARRLYVGNLPVGTTESAVAGFFNDVLRRSRASLGDDKPVVTTYLKMEKRFAFIELRTVSEAVAALMLDGIQLHGLPLRIRRPNDFPATAVNAQPPPTFDPALLGMVCTQVPDSAHKLFIGGIPYHLSEEQVKELLTTYGRLSAFNLVKEPGTGLSKGYAFCEYVDLKVVDTALAGLNGMKIEDKTLTVRRASMHGVAEASLAMIGVGGAGPAVGATLPPAVAAPSGPLVGRSTSVLELRNVVLEEDLHDQEEYEEICEEMKDEGSKYGKLEDVVVPRPKGGESKKEAEARGVGRVFLKYATNAECERAHVTLSGRKFDQRIVRASYFDEAKFEQRNFS